MPYIKKEARENPDKVVVLMKKLKINIVGELKHLLVKYFEENVDIGYNIVKNYCGELHQCGVECVRRLPKKPDVIAREIDKNKIKSVVDLMDEINVIANGDLNYILFKFCKERKLNPEQFQDELEYAIRTIEKFHLAPYEDKKIISNGDV